jgi:hypothetical protein
MKNSKRTNALRPFVQNYTHFTGILAYGMLYTNKLNDGISVWDFAHRQVYSWVECPENFRWKECSPLQNIKVSKITRISRKILEFSVFWDFNILERETLFWSEIFRTFYSQIDPSMGKGSDQNTVIQFIGISACPRNATFRWSSFQKIFFRDGQIWIHR